MQIGGGWSHSFGDRNVLTGAVFVITKIIDVINWWRDAVADFVEAKGIEGIIEMFGSFISALAAGPTLIASYWDQIVGVFESAWASITGTVSNGVDQVVALIASLPGRVPFGVQRCRCRQFVAEEVRQAAPFSNHLGVFADAENAATHEEVADVFPG